MSTIKRFAKWVDDQIDFRKFKGITGVVLEIADGPVLSIGFEAGYNLLSDEDKATVDNILEAIMACRWDDLTDESIEFLVVKINTPLGNDIERVVLENLRNMVFDIISIKKQQAQSSGGINNGDPGQGPPDQDPD